MLIIAIVAAGCAPATAPPDTLRPFRLIDVDPDRSVVADGYLLVTQLDDRTESFVSVLDGDATHVWWHQNRDQDDKHMRARISGDGQSVLVGARHKNPTIDVGEIRQIDVATGEVTTTRALDHHHDFVELPDGTLAYLSRDRMRDEWFTGKWPLAVDVVRTAEIGQPVANHEQVIHLVDDLEITPWFTCSHMPQTEFLEGYLDFTHANSLAYHPESDSYTIGVRHMNGVLRIGADGAVRWWLGGRFATLSPESDARTLRHAHFSDVWEDGLIAFDNRNHEPGAISRVVELAIDEAKGTFREVWSYDHPEGEFFAARGDAHRLPGGNVLIVWTGPGEIWEVTRGGDIVWSAKTTHRVARVQYLPDWPPTL